MAHKQLNTFHLFSGAGGGILADLLLGHNPIGACEIEEYPRNVLLARQRDGILPEFPIWDDICTLDGKPWRGSVDVLCGGFPCQDISAAGKGAGITGERSGLWKEYARLIDEMRPKFVFAENSPLLRKRGLDVVLRDLAELGYDARWCVLGAWHVGAPHKRDRMWVLAYANSNGYLAPKEREGSKEGGDGGSTRQKQAVEPERLCASETNVRVDPTPANVADPGSQGLFRGKQSGALRAGIKKRESRAHGSITQCGGASRFAGWWEVDPAEYSDSTSEGLEGSEWTKHEGRGDGCSKLRFPTGRERATEPLVGRVAHELADPLDITGASFYGRIPRVATGVDNRVGRLKAIGNGQVPQCAALAWNILSEGLI